MAEPATKKARVENLGTLTYFPLFAKGLAPALCAEMSGITWKSNRHTKFGFAAWPELKASGRAPFGQLPILETESWAIGQSVAICNYIGRVGGLEGKDDQEYAISQMLMAEGEYLYNLMQNYQPTIFVKEKSENNNKLWNELAPAELKKLEMILTKTDGDGFTSSKSTVGELYLFAMLHQMALVSPQCLESTPGITKFYESTKQLPAVKNVLDGNSPIGKLEQYFVSSN